MQSGWSLLGPLKWSRYVNKKVKVKAGKDEELRGWLLTVDPVSASVVLVDLAGLSVQVVLGHAVLEVEVLQEADAETQQQLQRCFLPPRRLQPPPEELQRRRGGLLRALQLRRIPVSQQGAALQVAGVLTISPPYEPENCCSANHIILDRIQKLIQGLNQQPQPDPQSEPQPDPQSEPQPDPQSEPATTT